MDDPVKAAKSKTSTAKGKFHRIYNRLLVGEKKKDDVSILQKMLEELESAHTNAETMYDTLLELLDPDKDENKPLMKDCIDNATVLYNELCDARLLLRSLETNGKDDVKTKPIMPIKV